MNYVKFFVFLLALIVTSSGAAEAAAPRSRGAGKHLLAFLAFYGALFGSITWLYGAMPDA